MGAVGEVWGSFDRFVPFLVSEPDMEEWQLIDSFLSPPRTDDQPYTAGMAAACKKVSFNAASLQEVKLTLLRPLLPIYNQKRQRQVQQ